VRLKIAKILKMVETYFLSKETHVYATLTKYCTQNTTLLDTLLPGVNINCKSVQPNYSQLSSDRKSF